MSSNLAPIIFFERDPTKPQHVHVCVVGDKAHQWLCSSPYCENVKTEPRTCVEHGGEPPRK